MGNTNFKLGQYADDTFLLLDGSEASLRKSLTIFEEFYLCSGLKLNFDKTFAVWLGSKSKSKLGFNVPFNSQGHIGTGPQHCHLWDSNPQR